MDDWGCPRVSVFVVEAQKPGVVCSSGQPKSIYRLSLTGKNHRLFSRMAESLIIYDFLVCIDIFLNGSNKYQLRWECFEGFSKFSLTVFIIQTHIPWKFGNSFQLVSEILNLLFASQLELQCFCLTEHNQAVVDVLHTWGLKEELDTVFHNSSNRNQLNPPLILTLQRFPTQIPTILGNVNKLRMEVSCVRRVLYHQIPSP